MLRPQKHESAARNRTKLEPWTRTPTLGDVESLMRQAEGKKGGMFEVAIRREGSPVFVLTCQYDGATPDPIWSLYEGEDGARACWSYPQGNLDMIYEIICMSLPGGIKSSAPAKMLGSATPAKPDPSK